MSLKKQKQKLERKLAVHFLRRTLINEKIKSNHKDSKTTQPKLSMKVKTKSKPMCSSMQMKNVLLNHQASEKHQALDSLPITGSQPIRQTQL
jgi:hypothetical protein